MHIPFCCIYVIFLTVQKQELAVAVSHLNYKLSIFLPKLLKVNFKMKIKQFHVLLFPCLYKRGK